MSVKWRKLFINSKLNSFYTLVQELLQTHTAHFRSQSTVARTWIRRCTRLDTERRSRRASGRRLIAIIRQGGGTVHARLAMPPTSHASSNKKSREGRLWVSQWNFLLYITPELVCRLGLPEVPDLMLLRNPAQSAGGSLTLLRRLSSSLQTD